tara:strand:+ start:156 stop:326 length:171 start_codon:yes stop_codon:yes gene_type:complete
MKSLNDNGKILDGFKSTKGLKLQQEDLIFLKELCEAEKLKAGIERQYKVEEMVEVN